MVFLFGEIPLLEGKIQSACIIVNHENALQAFDALLFNDVPLSYLGQILGYFFVGQAWCIPPARHAF